MKNIKNLLVIGAVAMCAVMGFKAQAENIVIGGYPQYTGHFVQGPNCFVYINTNAATLTRVANPITATNSPWASPQLQGFITVNVVTTNCSCYLSNYATSEVVYMGSGYNYASATTNFSNCTLRSGPGDTFIVGSTNSSSASIGVGVVSSEWRN